MACAADRPPNDPEPVRAEFFIRTKTRRPYLFRAKYLKRLPDSNSTAAPARRAVGVGSPGSRQGQPQLKLTAGGPRSPSERRTAASPGRRGRRRGRGTQRDADLCAWRGARVRCSVATLGVAGCATLRSATSRTNRLWATRARSLAWQPSACALGGWRGPSSRGTTGTAGPTPVALPCPGHRGWPSARSPCRP